MFQLLCLASVALTANCHGDWYMRPLFSFRSCSTSTSFSLPSKRRVGFA